MQRHLSYHLNSHVVALAGAVALHAGLAAWAMQPTKAVAFPEQQIIQIAMVQPSTFSEAIPEPAQPEPAPLTPPKPDGMIKVESVPEIRTEKKKKERKEIVKTSAPSLPTSGMQSPDATLKNAAVTEPQFDADYLRNPPPVYPQRARRRGAEGKVMLEVAVTREGDARDVFIARSSGSGILDEAARDAVQRWRFIPARRGSELVEARVIVPVEFRLN